MAGPEKLVAEVAIDASDVGKKLAGALFLIPKEIKLSKGKKAWVDPDCFEFLNRFKWYCHKSAKKEYARRDVKIEGRTYKIYMHRLVLGLPSNIPIRIDHINSNGLDNRKSNLRSVTHSQNMQNRDMVNNKNGFKGVSRRSSSGKYYARLVVEGETRTGPPRKTAVLAAFDYDELARWHHGKYAKTNLKLGLLDKILEEKCLTK